VAIALFPIGLLALLGKERAMVMITVSPITPQRTAVAISGTYSDRFLRIVEGALRPAGSRSARTASAVAPEPTGQRS
jgi:hypothetical protein